MADQQKKKNSKKKQGKEGRKAPAAPKELPANIKHRIAVRDRYARARVSFILYGTPTTICHLAGFPPKKKNPSRARRLSSLYPMGSKSRARSRARHARTQIK